MFSQLRNKALIEKLLNAKNIKTKGCLKPTTI